MIGERKEERRLFTWEERRDALKRSGGICACCGKKLTTKTMTVEHVIPLIRGGTNDMENLIALCEDCNKLKGNMLYMPYGFYLALKQKPVFHELEHQVRDWFETVKDEFDIARYPMISPQTFIQLNPVVNSMRHNQRFLPQLLFKWSMVGTDLYEEIEAVTGLRLRDVRDVMWKASEQDPDDPQKYRPVPIYCLKKVKTDKILAVIALVYYEETDTLSVYIPWHTMPKDYIGSMVFNFIYNLLDTLINIAGRSILQYTIVSEYKEALNVFLMDSIEPFIGISRRYGTYTDEDTGNIEMYRVDISRMPIIDFKHKS